METFSKSKWVSFKKEAIHPMRRWGHTSTLIGDQLYIFGGKLDQQFKKSSDSFYRMSCTTFDFKKLELPSNPELRDSHIAFTYNNRLYIWGGIIKEMVTNDCYVYQQNVWTKLVQNGQIPKPRQSPVSTIKDNFLLIYGGCNEETVYQDFNLFDLTTNIWYPVTVLNKIPKRQNSSITTVGNHLYLFGGQTEINEEQKFLNDIYKLTLSINLPNVQLKSEVVKAKNQPPTERSSHCAVVYSNRYLIVIGGLSFSIAKDDSLHILNDVWSFDLGSQLWSEIKPANPSLFKKHANFSAELVNENIFVFGGLKSTTNWNSYDDLLVLHLFDLEDYTLSSTCTHCKMPYLQQPEQIKETETDYQEQKIHNINTKTLYKMAQFIPHPFQAIGLLIKSSLMIKSTQILIKLQQISNRKVLSIFDNGFIVDKQQFQRIVFDSSIPKLKQHSSTQQVYLQSIKEYSNAVKYGCFKLSESFLFVHTNDIGNMAAVVTSENSYYYNIYFNQRQYETDENSYQKLRDYTIVSNIFKHIGQTHHTNCNTKKILFNLTCDGKKSNYQLGSLGKDIILKRIVDLKGAEESLREFINDYFLYPPKVRLFIFDEEVKIQARVYLYNVSFETGVVISITKNNKTAFNVYSKGFLVGRLTNCMYKVGGVVVVPDQWEIDHLGLGVSEELAYLQQLVEIVLKQYSDA